LTDKQISLSKINNKLTLQIKSKDSTIHKLHDRALKDKRHLKTSHSLLSTTGDSIFPHFVNENKFHFNNLTSPLDTEMDIETISHNPELSQDHDFIEKTLTIQTPFLINIRASIIPSAKIEIELELDKALPSNPSSPPKSASQSSKEQISPNKTDFATNTSVDLNSPLKVDSSTITHFDSCNLYTQTRKRIKTPDPDLGKRKDHSTSYRGSEYSSQPNSSRHIAPSYLQELDRKVLKTQYLKTVPLPPPQSKPPRLKDSQVQSKEVI
jgi:hypothetical protein